MPSDESLFEESRLLSSEERCVHLHRATSDTEQRQRVEALLFAYDSPGSFLAQPVAVLAPTTLESPVKDEALTLPALGSFIGPYKLLEVIGEGGMGVVFVAEQQAPLVRRVALKIIKPGMNSRQVLARFEAERQALALMEHPNIARVFDAGLTSEGRPYFVMELVKGVPITQYCDEHELSIKQRLERFIPVCQAIQHAHLKGIIHRDLKPSNVLVAEFDETPIVKVIDFGVSKALNQSLTDNTIYTQIGQIIGTLEYMSPEQAKLNQLDIDTRSDIYALGVILYKLLTGLSPFDRDRLRSAALDEVLRIIREEEPPRPSTRLSTVQTKAKPAPPGVSKSNAAPKALRGELDWIVMKCLEKDRARRYQAADNLARDLQRHLANEPVEARPPSSWYRARKYIRRNRLRLALLATGIVAVASAIVMATMLQDPVIVGNLTSGSYRWNAMNEQIHTEYHGRQAGMIAIDQLTQELLAKAEMTTEPTFETREQLMRLIPIYDRLGRQDPKNERPQLVIATGLTDAARVRVIIGQWERNKLKGEKPRPLMLIERMRAESWKQAEADLRSAEKLWQDETNHFPKSEGLWHYYARCLSDLGQICAGTDRQPEAEMHFRAAIGFLTRNDKSLIWLKGNSSSYRTLQLTFQRLEDLYRGKDKAQAADDLKNELAAINAQLKKLPLVMMK